MQCVPWPCPSWTSSPETNDFVVIVRPCEVRVGQVEAGVEHRDPHAAAGPAAVDDLGGLQAPRRLRLVERRGDRRDPGGGLGGDARGQVQHGLAVAAQVLRAERPGLRRRGRAERRRVGDRDRGVAVRRGAAWRARPRARRRSARARRSRSTPPPPRRRPGAPAPAGRRRRRRRASRSSARRGRRARTRRRPPSDSGRIASWTVWMPAADGAVLEQDQGAPGRLARLGDHAVGVHASPLLGGLPGG